MEFHEQNWRFGEAESSVLVARAYLNVVHELETGEGYPALNCGDGCLAGNFDRRKWASASCNRFGNALETQGQFSDDAKRPLGTYEKSSEIIASRRLSSPARARHNLAVRKNSLQGQNVVLHRSVPN